MALKRARGAPQRPYSGPLGFLLKQGRLAAAKLPLRAMRATRAEIGGEGGGRRRAPCDRSRPASYVARGRRQHHMLYSAMAILLYLSSLEVYCIEMDCDETLGLGQFSQIK